MRNFIALTLTSVALFLCGHAITQVTIGKFQQRDAWVLSNSKLRVTILQSGGHIGEIALTGPESVNPLWIQNRPTIDADQYDPAKHERIYGPGSVARLMAGLLGHNVCFPFWGDPSPAEAAAGMTFHGETGIVRWRQIAKGADFITVAAQLGESGTTFTRTIRLTGQVAAVEEAAQNDKAWDRPVGWCQHVTIGPPFLERGVTRFNAALTRGRADGKSREFQWPAGQAETDVDLRTVRNVPRSAGFVNNFLVDPAREYGYFTAFHPKHRLVFGYVFPRSDYAWLNIWEANSPELLTRGMEFSNTPVHGTMKALMKTPELWGVPTFDWLDAKSRLRKRFWAFSLRVPASFQGVKDVEFRDGRIDIVEEQTGRKHVVPSS